MLEFKTVVVCAEGYHTLGKLNEFYSEGWEFVDATAPSYDGGEYISHLYFTLKREVNLSS